ncbi:MAG: PEP-CTERM system histidine kinase PrsK [Sphingomonadales bacterium]|nr:PEP-CTERM system histidine kinase PrsK [Sphingomonadales bacterium]MBD3772762.1 PEP-CTERM system histidine kinase PrsK [Paracoccaceae bacterium]
MSGTGPDFWHVAGFAINLAGAITCALVLAYLWQRGDRARPDHRAAMVALAITATWSVLAAAFGPASSFASLAETARNLAWLMVLYRLFASDGRHESMAPIRPVLVALGFVECLHPALLFVGHRFALTPELQDLTYHLIVMFRALTAIGALMLVHNLYAGASGSNRVVLRWSAAALAGMWVYDLNLYTIGYLGQELPRELASVRGLVAGAMAVLFALGGDARSAQMRLRPSRAVAFQTLSLLVIGIYLLVMVGLAQSLDFLGGNLARLTQVGFIFAAIVVALLWLPSRKLRGWLRVTALKHLFQHRYDYRAEWLRFMATIGRGDGSAASLPQRAVKVLADITDSGKGLLMAPGEDGTCELVARWQWDECDVPAAALPRALGDWLEARSYILDLDELRAGSDPRNVAHMVPDWLCENRECWALVPLVHFDRLMGVVVLSRPFAPRPLDWEDFDLLKLVGAQLASYLAEQAGQAALLEASRFDEFNRRIAFVMHDIKNLASQLGLLARNAERHADNPAFRADMLVTLRNSADKLNALLARLNRYGASGAEKREPVEIAALVERVAGRFSHSHPVILTRKEDCRVLGDAEALEQALVHLVQNAIDASDQSSPVYLEAVCGGLQGKIQVVDSGAGMTPEFIRNGLFKPFVSSKNGGFGIGAFEARELVRSMGGRLDVESRQGLGTRFAISLPAAAAAQAFPPPNNSTAEVA